VEAKKKLKTKESLMTLSLKPDTEGRISNARRPHIDTEWERKSKSAETEKRRVKGGRVWVLKKGCWKRGKLSNHAK